MVRKARVFMKNLSNKNEVSAGFAIISNGKILLGKSSGNNKKRSWGVFKGKVEGGEEIIDGAIRELYEESGLNILESEYLQKCTSTVPVAEYSMYGGKKKVYIYLINDNKGILKDFNFYCDPNEDGLVEVSEFKWFDKDEAEMNIFWSQICVIDKLSHLMY